MASKSFKIALGLGTAALAGAAALPLAGQAQAPAGIDVIAVRKAGQDLVAGDFIGLSQAAKNKIQDVKPFAPAALALTSGSRNS